LKMRRKERLQKKLWTFENQQKKWKTKAKKCFKSL
jgi:hypothetical protein